MARYQIWDRKSDVYTPSGNRYTAEEWLEKFQWAKQPGARMVISGGAVNGALVAAFDTLLEQYKRQGAAITDDMTAEEVLAAIEAFEDDPPSSSESSAEERIAAALELANVMKMDTVNDDDPDE